MVANTFLPDFSSSLDESETCSLGRLWRKYVSIDYEITRQKAV